MAETLNLAGVSADLLEYARDNKDHIFLDMYSPSEDEADPENFIPAMDDYTVEMDTPDEVVFTNIYAEKAFRPGKKTDGDGKMFRPNIDAVKMKTRKGKVRDMSIDLLFTQEKISILKRSYFAQCKRMKINPDVLPFEAFILESVMKKAKEELRLAYFTAVYDDEGDSYLDCFDGIIKQIADSITSAELPAGNLKGQAAIAANNGVAQFEAIVDIIPTAKLGNMVCLVSRKVKKYYEDDYRTRYGTLPWNAGVRKAKIDGTSIPLFVEPGLDAYTKPLFIPKNNIIRLYDTTSDKLNLDVDYDKRERNIAFVCDGQAGVGIGLMKDIYSMVVV